MRKLKIFYLLIVSSVLLLCFSKCDKNGPSTVKIHCHYVHDNADTVKNIDSVWVEVDTSKLSPRQRTDSIINEAGQTQYFPRTNYCNDEVRSARGYTKNGLISFTFSQPIVILVNAYDTVVNTDGTKTYYRGKSEISIKSGVEVEENIYLFPYTNF